MGKINVFLALIVSALVIATPMRTGQDAGQMPSVNRSMLSCHNHTVKKAKKRFVVRLNETEQKIATFIKSVNKKVDSSLLARTIVKYAPKAALPPELFAAILAHESGNFTPNLKVCYARKGVTMCDHGMAQINDYYQAGKFDFERIQVDDVYSIQSAAKILAGLHKLYGEDMPTDWWATYNTVVEKPRKVYEALVMTKFSQVLAVTSST